MERAADTPGAHEAGDGMPALAELAAATHRVLERLDGLDDAAFRTPSALPGWTRGHVATHLARNADGLGRLVTWAATGLKTPMYDSPEARQRDIEAGAYQPATEICDDFRASSNALADALAAFPTAAHSVELTLGSGTSIVAWELPLVRIRELEIHHVDLAAGYRPEDWSPAFCARTLDQVASGFSARPTMPFGWLRSTEGASWRIGSGDASLSGPANDLLAWLLGRSSGERLTPVGRSDVPPAPAWA